MSKIDISSWSPFHLYDIFHITMGNKFDKGKMKETNPKVNFVGRSGVNNGVTCCVDYVYDEKGNLIQPYKAGDITIAMGGSVGSSFIQKNDFYTSQNVCVLHTDNPNITYMVKQFIITSICRSCTNYVAFVDELNRHIKTDFVIYLPIDSQGNPDWQYMEDYMRSIEVKVCNSISKLELTQKVENSKIDINGWGEFRISDYFKVEYGKFRPKEILGNGEFGYITTSGFNNGVTETIDVADHNGNCITVASDGALMGSAFYQENPFSTSNIVSTLTPFTTTPLNKYNAMFLCTLIFSKRSEFGWLGFKFSVDRVRNLKLKLPIDSNGNPDWQYMEDYMEGLEIMVNNFVNKTE